jgi:D-proline reductase (dithiol) PrdB
LDIIENKTEWIENFRKGWLAHHVQTGEQNWKIYNQVINKQTPAGRGVDVSRSRLMLISTSGAYLKDTQPAFDAPNPLGDYSLRTFPVSTAFDALDYAHDHYDHQYVHNDPQVLLPLRYLEEMVAQGRIGDLAPRVVSFSGYQPDAARVEDELIPEVLRIAQEQRADAALIVPS